MSRKRSRIQIQLQRSLSPDFPAAHHSKNDVTHCNSGTTHTFLRYTRWRSIRERWWGPHKNEWENSSQTPAILEKTLTFRAKIPIWWASRDLAELGHLVFISGKWEMRAQTREREQVLSALHPKFQLKINIAAYGRDDSLLVALGLLNPKPLIPHLKWDHHL